MTINPDIDGVEVGMKVEGVDEGICVGKADGVDVINMDCISTLQLSPITSSKVSIDAFTSAALVASIARFTSA